MDELIAALREGRPLTIAQVVMAINVLDAVRSAGKVRDADPKNCLAHSGLLNHVLWNAKTLSEKKEILAARAA